MSPAELYPPIRKDRDLPLICGKRRCQWAGEVAQHGQRAQGPEFLCHLEATEYKKRIDPCKLSCVPQHMPANPYTGGVNTHRKDS